MNRKKLGEILVDSNLLTEEQVQQALRIQERRGGKLGEIFVELGLVDEKTIADFVSLQRDFKRIELNLIDIDRDLLPHSSGRLSEISYHPIHNRRR